MAMDSPTFPAGLSVWQQLGHPQLLLGASLTRLQPSLGSGWVQPWALHFVLQTR